MKKRTISILTAAAVAALSAVSCLPDKEYMFSDTGMCTPIAINRLRTDSGSIYNVTENSTGTGISDTLKRVMISCDVTSQVPGTSNEYNIRIIDWAPADCREAIYASSEEAATAGDDGLNIVQAWVSGGHLNTFSNFAVLYDSETEHDVNLVYDDFRSNSDTLYFKMHQDGRGESPQNEEYDIPRFAIVGCYSSFPISSIIDGTTAGGKAPILHLEWDWYDDDGMITRTKTTRSGNVLIQ